ncbi:hypothetical protein DSL72_004480 [Monilinia vaccinii-corymbosi]|uniref:Uncharacterized protein n=1 Tax=Monilinia vaccinii-corymbosi TaxID=61207 RepID=A0A8A3NZD4_9HELO|nr:hypothetical protein DSL72_004480 [Monilinia vaccinii-corymbosi]
MSKNHTNIPLLCSICPKNPRFSDVSHLLTHTSSKAHLSNYFKLKIRAASELTAKVQLDNFEDWYDSYDLERLLSERLASKDQKKAAKDKKVRSSKAIMQPGRSKIKREDNNSIPDDESNLAPMFRAPVPRMHLWPTTTNTNIGSNMSTSNSDIGSEWDHNTVYATPTSRRHIPGYTFQRTPSAGGTPSVSTNLTTPMKEGDVEIIEKLSESAKLKGVLWPGMDLFDSATAEMKRMRNQRKDGSILELMMVASAEVQPTEVSYHPDGAFRTARNIFGPLSTETSPIRDPTPKKRRTRKVALTDVSVNVPRLRASRPQRNSARSPEKRHVSARIQHQPAGQLALHPPPALNPLAFGARFTPTTEEDEEFRITMEEMGAKKRAFNVFQDAPEVSPGRTESPLEDHRFDFSDGTSNSFTNANIGNQISPTPIVKPTAMRMFVKENSQSDNQVRRTVSTPHHGFPAQMFFDHASMYNPLYNHHPRSFSYGGDHTDLSQVSQDIKPMNTFGQGFHDNFSSVSHTSHLPSNHLHISGPITNGANVNMSHFGM